MVRRHFGSFQATPNHLHLRPTEKNIKTRVVEPTMEKGKEKFPQSSFTLPSRKVRRAFYGESSMFELDGSISPGMRLIPLPNIRLETDPSQNQDVYLFLAHAMMEAKKFYANSTRRDFCTSKFLLISLTDIQILLSLSNAFCKFQPTVIRQAGTGQNISATDVVQLKRILIQLRLTSFMHTMCCDTAACEQ